MNKNNILVMMVFGLLSNYGCGQGINLKEDIYPVGISKSYSTKLKVGKCFDEACDVTITLYRKGSNNPLQVFRTTDVSREPSIIFDDFNFDGTEDLAIQNGPGGYGMGSYNVYVYHSTKKQFVASKELTALASSQGMFHLNKKKKQILSTSKSGCCWHRSERFQVVPGKGLIKIYDLVEEATEPEGYVLVTEKKLVNNKWNTSKKKHKTTDYYKD